MAREDIQVFLRTRSAYEKFWKSVDKELYELCERRGNNAFADVFTKVAVINRVYQAGLLRMPGGEGEEKAAQVLKDNATTFEEHLGRLSGGGRFDVTAASTAIEAHGELSELIAAATQKRPVSFVSKYLHFHRPSVPIFDIQAVGSLKKHIPRKELSAARKAIPSPPIYNPDYYKFVCRFLAFYDQLASTELGPTLTVKGVDTMLWDPVTPTPQEL